MNYTLLFSLIDFSESIKFQTSVLWANVKKRNYVNLVSILLKCCQFV